MLDKVVFLDCTTNAADIIYAKCSVLVRSLVAKWTLFSVFVVFLLIAGSLLFNDEFPNVDISF